MSRFCLNKGVRKISVNQTSLWDIEEETKTVYDSNEPTKVIGENDIENVIIFKSDEPYDGSFSVNGASFKIVNGFLETVIWNIVHLNF